MKTENTFEAMITHSLAGSAKGISKVEENILECRQRHSACSAVQRIQR